MTLTLPGEEPRPRALPGGSTTDDAAIDQALREADAGRRLDIYERITGLFEHWYLALRCDEECYRARRHERPFSLVVIESQPGSEAWQFTGRTAEALKGRLRQSDLAGYLGSARFAVLMPEIDQTSADSRVGRLLRASPGSQAGISTFPRDGLSFKSLYAVAVRRLSRGTAIRARRYRRIHQVA